MSAHSESPTTSLPPPPIRAAGSPFDKASADIILRTADRVDFRVHSHILIVASPVFESILGLPHTPGSTGDETLDGRPVIEISEDSACLDTILRICYPVEEGAPPATVGAIEVLLEAAAKYEMHYPSCVLNQHFLEIAVQKPFEAYAAACRLGSEALARRCAELTSTATVAVENPRWGHDMGAGTAGQYFRLLEFCRLSQADQVPHNYRFVTPNPVPFSSTELPSTTPLWSTTVPTQYMLPNMPFPDLVCRSSDGHDFEVHRGIVSAASPTLYERIKKLVSGRPVSGDDAKAVGQALPILPLEECGTVLAAILRMCYPMALDLPLDPRDFANVLSAARKYSMTKACKKIQKRWHAVAETDPLRAYFVAVHVGWQEGAERAAQLLANRPLEGMYISDMELVSASSYNSLIAYQEMYKDALGKLSSEHPALLQGLPRMSEGSAFVHCAVHSEQALRNMESLLDTITARFRSNSDSSYRHSKSQISYSGSMIRAECAALKAIPVELRKVRLPSVLVAS
ncbi:hypothetical protein C8Q80DRAFT_1272839 [Daedaleopsis nitida]|nr:hypothetical protein C8Q80DRAFT_1272839 [Daedaleopsis nitida]